MSQKVSIHWISSAQKSTTLVCTKFETEADRNLSFFFFLSEGVRYFEPSGHLCQNDVVLTSM